MSSGSPGSASGLSRRPAFQIAHEAMYALPMVESPLGSDVFDEAVQLYRSARRTGLTVRSAVDCLIAACALRHRLTVLHRNRDFDSIARVSPLQAQSILRKLEGLPGKTPAKTARRRVLRVCTDCLGARIPCRRN